MSVQHPDERHTLFTEADWTDLLALGQPFVRGSGEVLFAEGDPANFVLLILSGHVKICVGWPERTVAVRRAGEVVGEMAVVRKVPRSATAKAFGAVEALWVPGDAWVRFLRTHPDAAIAQLIATDERLEQATRKIPESDFVVERRLAMGLVELVDSGLGGEADGAIVLEIGQQDLAAHTGASLDSVKKVVRGFKDGGLIATARGKTIILDLAAVRRIADGEAIAAPRQPD